MLPRLPAEFAIDRGRVCVLHLSTWVRRRMRLRLALSAGELVYDCMDDWSGFAVHAGKRCSAMKLLLVGDSDLVVVTAQKALGPVVASESQHRARPERGGSCAFPADPAVELPVEMPSSGPVIGFLVLIDSWFDVELVRSGGNGAAAVLLRAHR